MNVWKHCLLSQKKFGGIPQDYAKVHSFIDSSKLFYYHIKHRLLLHNLYGIELCTELFGDMLVNSDGVSIPVRDIGAEHCREDLSDTVPSLNDWLSNITADTQLVSEGALPKIEDQQLESFLLRPYLRTGLRDSLFITYSNFGVYLVERFFGFTQACTLAKVIEGRPPVSHYLQQVRFSQRWQYTPNKKDLEWLRSMEHDYTRTSGTTT